MFILPSGTCISHHSHLGRGLGCSSRILILSTQCCMLKCDCKSFHVWEDPWKPGKNQGHRFFDRRMLTLYIWVWCTACLTGSQLQLIAGYTPCIQHKFSVVDPVVSSTSYSGHVIQRQSLTRYESPTPVLFSAMASSDIPAHNALGCHFIVRDLATLAARPYPLKRPTRTFIACYIHSGLHELTIPSSE